VFPGDVERIRDSLSDDAFAPEDPKCHWIKRRPDPHVTFLAGISVADICASTSSTQFCWDKAVMACMLSDHITSCLPNGGADFDLLMEGSEIFESPVSYPGSPYFCVVVRIKLPSEVQRAYEVLAQSLPRHNSYGGKFHATFTYVRTRACAEEVCANLDAALSPAKGPHRFRVLSSKLSVKAFAYKPPA